jgi:hypothetical protein
MKRWPRTVCGLVIAVEACLVVSAVVTGLAYIWRGVPDFEYFYEDGKFLLKTGAIGRGQDLPDSPHAVKHFDASNPRRDWLRWYWPFIHRVCSPLGLMRWHVAGVVWVIINLACWVLTVRWVGRELSGMPPDDWPYTQFVPVLFMAVFWLIHFRLNQVNLIVLAFMVAAFVAWQRRQPLRGGFLMGVAVLLKVTPVFMLLWFALKRQWGFLASALLTLLLFGPVADVVIFGREQAIIEYRRWYRDAVTCGSGASLIRAERNIDYRNKGLAVTLYRLLHHASYARKFDEEPRVEEAPEVPAYVNLLNLAPSTIIAISTLLSAVSLAAMVWECRKPAERTDPFRCRMEWALFMLAMLWFMPVLRRYHFVWAYPALALWMAYGNRCERAGVRSKAVVWVSLAWALAMVLIYFRTARAAGVTLWAVFILGAAIWWALHRMRRPGDPTAKVLSAGTEATEPAAPPSVCDVCERPTA